MNEQEIEERIEVCEKCERDYREVGNTKTADRYSNEKYKWEKLLSKLNPKRDKELADYKKGYGLLKQALNEIKDYIKSDKAVIREYENPTYLREEYCVKNILQIIDKSLGEEKC